MNRYLVTLSFEDELEIEAENEEEALNEAYEIAYRLGEWDHDVEFIESLDEDDDDDDI